MKEIAFNGNSLIFTSVSPEGSFAVVWQQTHTAPLASIQSSGDQQIICELIGKSMNESEQPVHWSM